MQSFVKISSYLGFDLVCAVMATLAAARRVAFEQQQRAFLWRQRQRACQSGLPLNLSPRPSRSQNALFTGVEGVRKGADVDFD